MVELSGDFRPAGQWTRLRTACHGCRTSFFQREIDDNGVQSNRQVLMPGDGTVARLVSSATDERQVFVTEPCAICGGTETPGWLPGFVPPE
jgi:hypothetical protein